MSGLSISSSLGFGDGLQFQTKIGTASLVDTVNAADYSLLPTSGLIGDYRFTEGSGDIIANQVNALKPIDLASVTSQSATWTTAGIKTTNGLVDIPSLTGVVELAMLYRVARNEANAFLISGGSGGSGSGWFTNVTAPPEGAYIGENGGVSPIASAANGQAADRLNRGGWKVAYRVMTQFTGKLGLAGRHSATTFRCSEFDVAGVWIWNRSLSDQERTDVFNMARTVALSRNFYIDWRDCPIQGDLVMLMGESNAEGLALLSGLSAGDQARATTNTLIEADSNVTQNYPPATFVLGTNQTVNAPATYFGPEVGMAWARQSGIKKQLLAKLAKGSTFLAPSSTGVSTSQTWNADELKTSAGLWTYFKYYEDCEDYWLLNGIGPKLIAVVWVIGLNDATSTTYASSASVYKGYLTGVRDAVKTYLHYGSDVQHVIVRAHNHDPSSNATALSNVRQGQADFVSDNSGYALINSDDITLNVDQVHFNATAATGQPYLGQLISAAITGWS